MDSNDFKIGPTLPKTNQGFLWNISNPEEPGKSTHVLCMGGNLWENPLETNPKVKEVFQNAECLYLQHPPLENSEGIKRLWEEIDCSGTGKNLELLSEIKKLASGYLSKIELSPFASEIYDIYDALQNKSLYQDVLANLFIIGVNHLETHWNFNKKDFFSSISQCGKEIHFLQSEEEYLENLQILLKCMATFFDNEPPLLWIKDLFEDRSQLDNFLNTLSLQYQLWNQGDAITYDDLNPSFEEHQKPFQEFEELKQRGLENYEKMKGLLIQSTQFVERSEDPDNLDYLVKAVEILEPFRRTKMELEALSLKNQPEKELVDTFAEMESKTQKSLLDRVPEILAQKKRTMVVIDSIMPFLKGGGTVSVANEMKLKIQQVTIPMKPVGFFWKIKDNKGRKAYLLGTMHYAPEELINLNSKIQKCFAKSQAIAVELDTTRSEVIEKTNKHPLMRELETESRKTFESMEKLERLRFILCFHLIAKKIGIKESQGFPDDYQLLNHYLTEIQNTIFSRIGYDSGIEGDLIPKAKQAGKPVQDLETYDGHWGENGKNLELVMSMKSGFLDPLFEMVRTILAENSNSNISIENLIEERLGGVMDGVLHSVKKPLDFFANIISKGYVDALIAMINDMPAEERKRVLNKRNFAMAVKIDDLVQNSGKRFFFMVGALHFPGEYGLIKLLENLDYTAQRVIVEEPL